MEDKELWQKIGEKKIKQKDHIVKNFFILKKKDFNKFKKYFPLKRKHSKYIEYKTDHWFKHLHAKEYKGYVDIHYDHGNILKNIFLSVIHLFLDIIPDWFFILLGKLRIVKFSN